MLLSNAPSKIVVPFASTGTKNTIPVPSQIGVTAGAASYTDGFPPLTMTPVSSGGIPPFGADFNGILNAVTAIQLWQSGGGQFSYDATWSSDNGGYPKGAMLLKGTGSGYWVCTADNNTTNPDGGSPANWVDFGQILAAVTTAALFNNTTAPASTAFVQRALGNWAGVTSISATATLTASAFGQSIKLTGSSPYTVTLPAASSISGGAIEFYNTGSASMTIARAGTDVINRGDVSGVGTQTAITLSPGDTLKLVSDGSSVFSAVSGSASLKESGAFRSSLGPTGWKMLPSGEIEQWGKTGTIAANSSQVITFPIPFPAAAYTVLITKENSDVTNEQTFDGSSLGLSSVTITNTTAVNGACWWKVTGK